MENPVDSPDKPINPAFNTKAGEFFSIPKAQELKDRYYNAKLSVGLKEDEFIRSEFFGLDRILALTKQKGCVGIRVHYAKRWEDEQGRITSPDAGKLTPRLLLTAVDNRGRDILNDVAPWGLKDDGEGDDGNAIVGDGWTCPKHCGG